MAEEYWIVKKRMEIAAAHALKHLDYESKCKNLHGHNWIVTVHVKKPKLDHNGMVIDFKHIKNMIHDKLDHGYVNDHVPHPTAENMAKWICLQIEGCVQVDVQESEGNTATYIRNS